MLFFTFSDNILTCTCMSNKMGWTSRSWSATITPYQ